MSKWNWYKDKKSGKKVLAKELLFSRDIAGRRYLGGDFELDTGVELKGIWRNKFFSLYEEITDGQKNKAAEGQD